MKTSLITKILLVIFLIPAVVLGSLLAIQILLKPPGTFKSELSLSDDPVLGQPVKLTLTLDYSPKCGKKNQQDDYDDYEDPYENRYFIALIELPEAFELVDGDLEWQGYLHCGQAPKKIEATIKAVQIGEYVIRAHISPDTWYFFGSAPIFDHDFRYLDPELFVAVFSDRGFASNKRIEMDGAQYPATSRSSLNERHITVDLVLLGKPSLSKDIEVKCTAIAMGDTPFAQIKLGFPEGFAVIKETSKVPKGNVAFHPNSTSSYLMWRGDMVKGDTIELAAVVKPLKTGRWNITTETVFRDSYDMGIVGFPAALTVYIFRDGGDVIHGRTLTYYDVDVELDLPIVPKHAKLNETVEVKCTVIANDNDVPKARLRLIPNDRYYVIQRDFSWEGDLIANVPIEVTAQIMPIRAGNPPIQAYLENYRSLPNRYVLIRKCSHSLIVDPL
jgi:hypothetical protein